jgi:polyphosphate:AMP phosphotransferase
MLKKYEKSSNSYNTNSLKEYKETLEAYQEKLSILERKARALKIPIIIVVEGWGASGKGQLINNIILPLDPRGFFVYPIKEETEEEKRLPFLWRFITKEPSDGRIAIFDRSWYRRVLNDQIDKKVKNHRLTEDLEEINSFEKLLTDNGTVIIKLFLHITKKEQSKRLDELLSKKETKWRVTDDDIKHNKQYAKYLKLSETILENTDFESSKWHIINANDFYQATLDTFKAIIETVEIEIERVEHPFVRPDIDKNISTTYLSNCDLSLDIDKKDYSDALSFYQNKLAKLHNILYLKKIPVVIVFEGWDAAGKGGAIKRLTTALDPRGYQVFSTPAPTAIEKSHHYLWRFWNNIPKTGHIAIFDRSWYGRLMVEPIEGFCSKEEYDRSFLEINNFEKHLSGSGIVILKFFIHISKDEQLNRFTAREKDPLKSWKITDEDFRNREKWDEYLAAIEKMIDKTNTKYAPWTVISGNSKKYARIEILKTITERLENEIEN